jgi:putative Ca2+/H+ antiporter (TMEM165/GDT1 family)
MSLTPAVATFLAVLPAELPDKTILACLILSSRYRPGYVFAAAAAAFLSQVVLGVAAGGALSLLPHRIIEACAAAAFVVGCLLLWRHKAGEQGDAEADKDISRDRAPGSGFWPVFGTAFAVVFLAEFGDLTQFMTVSLAARFHDPVSVGVGATLALWVAAAIAVTAGWRLLKLIPMRWLTRGAALIMLALAGTSAYAASS